MAVSHLAARFGRKALVTSLLAVAGSLGSGPTIAASALVGSGQPRLVLLSESPGLDATVGKLPDFISMRFNHRVTSASVEAISADGLSATSGPAIVEGGGRNVLTPLVSGTSAGSYEVQWEATVGGGQSATGEWEFNYRPGARSVSGLNCTDGQVGSSCSVAATSKHQSRLGLVVAIAIAAILGGTVASLLVRGKFRFPETKEPPAEVTGGSEAYDAIRADPVDSRA